MASIALAALVVSLLALGLFLIANYKKILTNSIQYAVSPGIDVRLSSGYTTSEDGSITVGGQPDDFEQELMRLQDESDKDRIEIPIDNISHPNGHSDIDHFGITIQNDGKRKVRGHLTIDADSTITNRHPDIPSTISSLAEDFQQLKKKPVPSGELLVGESIGFKQRYVFSDIVLPSDGRSSSSWYIEPKIFPSKRDKYVIKVQFVPEIAATELPWWVPEYIGCVEFKPVTKIFVIMEDVGSSESENDG